MSVLDDPKAVEAALVVLRHQGWLGGCEDQEAIESDLRLMFATVSDALGLDARMNRNDELAQELVQDQLTRAQGLLDDAGMPKGESLAVRVGLLVDERDSLRQELEGVRADAAQYAAERDER